MDTHQASIVLSALANGIRLDIFRTLISKGGMPARELADSVGLTPSNLSFHLKDMRFAGLVSSRRQGRQVIYLANFDNLNTLLEFLARDCCGGRPELCIRIVEPDCAQASSNGGHSE